MRYQLAGMKCLLQLVIVGGLVEFMEVVLSVKDRFQLVNNRLSAVVAKSNSKQLLWTVPLPIVETFTSKFR